MVAAHQVQEAGSLTFYFELRIIYFCSSENISNIFHAFASPDTPLVSMQFFIGYLLVLLITQSTEE